MWTHHFQWVAKCLLAMCYWVEPWKYNRTFERMNCAAFPNIFHICWVANGCWQISISLNIFLLATFTRWGQIILSQRKATIENASGKIWLVYKVFSVPTLHFFLCHATQNLIFVTMRLNVSGWGVLNSWF